MNQKYDHYRLGELCTIVSGGTPDTKNNDYWNGTIKWITPAEIKEDSVYIADTERHISNIGFEKAHLRLMPQGTVLLSSRAPIGKVAIAAEEMCCNQGFKNLICCRKLNNKFLYYFLKFNTDRIKRMGRGATFKEISAKVVENIEIFLPPLAIQETLVSQLDAISKLSKQYKRILQKLDELQKSRFIEMFGDPITNPKNLEKKRLLEITQKVGSGATPKGGKESYISNGISLIRSMNVHNGRFAKKDLAHISEEQAQELENVEVKPNDVLLNITGASVARSCVVPTSVLPARVNQHVAIIRPNTDVIDSIYLNHQLLNTSFQKYLLRLGESGGATRQALTKNQIENIFVTIPDLNLQRAFKACVELTNISKLAIQKSIDELEILKKKLMQEYFG